MHIKYKTAVMAASILTLTSVTATAQMAPFGDDKSINYAAQLWDAMVEAKLAGDGMIRSFPYEGLEPHGMMLETFYAETTIGDHTGALIVKRNFGPEGVEETQVLDDPAKHLGAYTVMFKREAGYDVDNNDWFWAKYLPDGSLDKNPKGMQLAGRVAKGADVGCIAHRLCGWYFGWKGLFWNAWARGQAGATRQYLFRQRPFLVGYLFSLWF